MQVPFEHRPLQLVAVRAKASIGLPNVLILLHIGLMDVISK